MMHESTIEPTVGFLYEGLLSDEQSAYKDLLHELDYDIELVDLDASADLTGYDVLSWHRDEPLTAESMIYAQGVQSHLREFLQAGGGLFLTLHALEAVEPLGIDTVAPDSVSQDGAERETGLLIKSLYRDHPVFRGFDGLRQVTQTSSRDHPSIHYERFVPANGDVLASTVKGAEDQPAKKSLCSWRVTNGEVVGLGSGCNALAATDSVHRETLKRFIDNVVRHLAEQNETPLGTSKSRARDDFDGMRARLSDDRHRPNYHLSPPANWLNDPNGIIEWDGEYHVFYQYNPAGPFHGTIHWGHARSEDLVHWEDQPIALTPELGSPDEDGCWSGCTVDHDGTPTFLYTGGSGRDQLPCIATGDENLTNWTKHPENPIIREAPDSPRVLSTEHWAAEFRDHCVWFEDDTWFQLIGSGVQDVGGTALLYTSSDLYEWDYQGPILIGDWPGSGSVWECPELLDLGAQDLLHVSDYSDVVYFLGSFEDGTFDPESRGKLDYGEYYAPQSLTANDGRTITWGWIQEGRSTEAQWDAGWSGMMSLPRVLRLSEDGELRIEPATELERLRESHRRFDVGELTSESPNPLEDVESTSCEIELEFEMDDAWEVGLSVFQSPAGTDQEQTLIRYTDEGQLCVDRRRSSLDSDASRSKQGMPLELREDGTVHLQCFIDGSVIEVFANGRKCLTCRVYPTREDSVGMGLYTIGGRAEIDTLDVWELTGAYRKQDAAEDAQITAD